MYYAVFGNLGLGVYDDKEKACSVLCYLHASDRWSLFDYLPVCIWKAVVERPSRDYLPEYLCREAHIKQCNTLTAAKNEAINGYNKLQEFDNYKFDAKRDRMIKLNWLYFRRKIIKHNQKMSIGK